MLNDVAWRKMPTDILTNENMTFIESQMPEEYVFAPYMFYMAALKKADDDGIFDLEDGMIFARLMRIESTELVFKIANLMGSRKIIGRVSATSNICFFVDWEYPNNRQKTWQQRREAVQIRINNNEQLNRLPNFEEKAPEIPFSAFECDKNQENVSQSVIVTKNNENVTQTAQCDKNGDSCLTLKRERERERIERETHTERDRESVREEERDSSASASAPLGLAPAPESRKKPLAKETSEKQKEVEPTTQQQSDTNISTGDNQKSQKSEKETGEILGVTVATLETWFNDNCFGFDSKKAKKQLAELSNRIVNLNCDTAKVTAGILNEFRQMHERDGPWKDIPLSPTLLLKPSVWTYVLNAVGKKLKITKKKTFLDNYQKYQKECEEERLQEESALNTEYQKYGISPDDPNKTQKLLAMKAQEQQEEIPEGIF